MDSDQLKERLPVTLRPLVTSTSNLLSWFGQSNYIFGFIFNSVMTALGVGVYLYFASADALLYKAIAVVGALWAIMHVLAIIKWGVTQ